MHRTIQSIVIFVSILTAGSSYAQVAGTITVDANQYMQMQNQQNGGCLNTMVNQIDKGMTSEFENLQQETNTLMGISQKYFEHAKTCRNDLGEALNKFHQEKLRHQQEQNKLAANMKMAHIEYRKSVLQIKKDCNSMSTEDFKNFKALTSSGVVTADRGGPQALFNRSNNINQWQKLFYDDCMAQKLNLEQVTLNQAELEVNLELMEANMKSSSDALSSMTLQLEQDQNRILQTCLEGEEQLKYQEALLKNQIAAAKALTKKQNMMGMLGAVNSCFFGSGGGMQSPDLTNRGPASPTRN